MGDLGQKIKNYTRSIKRRTFGISYGETWQGRNNKFYERLHSTGLIEHQKFLSYLKSKQDVKTILEIGCGAGVYPIKYKDIFEKFEYTGIDISKSAIEYCKNHSNFNFLCGDFQKMILSEKYDLIFSHGVIHHVYDINEFLSKIVEKSEKYAYILSSLGYSDELEDHEMEWAEKEAVYNSILSLKQVNDTLIKSGLKENQFSINPSETDSENSTGTLIEINKTL
ncbi:hypothetical protein C5F49_00745 [Nitrosopumilus oxyclinae]|uniref:Methyltransferase domain-containing protein n=1 Tax=Nitrosopumilus oxyclinae TaxID=1959104 RepID=A0A7D5M130_9ARCH|nr:class I SAM-dependent methyltransferase [Nitrosopumilus oxyclinae]QLH04012.1 hypothetical protein C5F49_00745 [Nitrosopumilus oxyclinae]